MATRLPGKILPKYNWNKITRNTDGVRSASYPWDQWFDGRIWKLTPDVDFTVPPFALERVIRTSANRRGEFVRVRIEEDGSVIVQTHDGSDNGRTPKPEPKASKAPVKAPAKTTAKVEKAPAKTAAKAPVTKAPTKQVAAKAPAKVTTKKVAPTKAVSKKVAAKPLTLVPSPPVDGSGSAATNGGPSKKVSKKVSA